MKANELMIGDWIRMHYPFDMDIDMRPERINVLTKGVDVDCEPIPLTTEILEKNGFICKGAWMISGEDLALKQCGDYFRLLPYYYDYNSTGMCDIYYVHELQHALRLCRIDKEIVL